MPTRKRRIKQADITFISLCPKGKNRLPVLFKEDGAFEFETLVKDDRLEEEGILTAVVWAPEFPDVEGDVASPEAVKKMAHSFARNGHSLDIRHDLKPIAKEDAYVAESYIIKKGDPDFINLKDRDNHIVDVTGGWAVAIKLEKEELKADYRAGKWNGVSMFGNAQVETIDKSDSILDALAERLMGLPKEDDMKPEELTKALEENNKALLEGLTKALAPKKEEPKDEAPKFEGDPLNKEEVEKHLDAVKAHRLAKSVDFNDPKAVENYLASLDKEEKPTEESDEVKELRKQLAKAVKASTQDDDDDDKDKAVERIGNVTGIKKEEYALAQRMADYVNGSSTTKKES